ncbi:MAG TPA: FtsX-like permease family protein [Ktedonobacterales bacterium]|nr:FtsX-like permease family protein [Ktedonobacterales bacterium]
MKLGIYWSYATRSLARNGQRTLLAIFCVAVGVLAIVSLQLVGNSVNDSFTSNLRALNGGDVSIATVTAPFTSDDLAYFDQLQSQGVLTRYAKVDNIGGEVRANGKSLRAGLAVFDPSQFPIAGQPTFNSPKSGVFDSIVQGNTVVITAPVADALNLHMGDTATIATTSGRTTTVTIGGIVQSSGFYSGPQMYMALDTYSALPSTSGVPVTFNTVYADVPGHTDANANTLKSQVKAKFPLTDINTTQDLLKSNQQAVSIIRKFLQIVGLLALLIGGIGIINTMQVLLRRRRTEIAMLKTAGYRRRDLYALFGLEAGLIGLVGGVVGALAGVAVSFGVKTLMQNLFGIQLPHNLDPGTILSGVAVGFVTALIFGLMPIVQASQVKPIGVLRELPEKSGALTIVLGVFLSLILAALFFVLSAVILQNVTVAIFAVGGAGFFFLLLSAFFGLVVFVISRAPVLESFRWWYVLLVVVGVAISLLLIKAVPALGILALAVALLGIVIVLLPRNWKTNVKLALRNIGRQKTRTVTTLLALYIGIFAIGLVLILGQNLKQQLNSFVSSNNGPNAAILAGYADKAAVDAQLSQSKGVNSENVTTDAQIQPVSVNGQSITTFITPGNAGGPSSGNNPQEVVRLLSGVQGYDLKQNQIPDATQIKLALGVNDTQMGRALTAADAGTDNIMLPVEASKAPLNLKLNDTVTVANRFTKQPITLTVVGFYTTSSFTATIEPVLADTGVVNTVTNNKPQYVYLLRLDPKSEDSILAKIEAAVPGVQTVSLGDLLNQITGYLNNLIVMLVAIASLAMLAGVIIIANSVALAMLERRRELGILKAVGHTSRSVLSEVLIENGIIGFTGAMLAMFFVSLATYLISKAVFKTPLSLSIPIVLSVVFATALVCMAVAAWVANSATRVRPLEVLRYE